MSAFVDATMLRFAQDAFVTGLLNNLGPTAIFNATFDATDIALQSVALGPISTRSYKVPTFETVRTSGTDERTLPDAQRVQKERVVPRSGRLEWVDVAFDAVLNTKVQTLVAPLQSVTAQTLEQRLGAVASIADLRAKLLALYAPSIVDALFAELNISTLDDFEQQHHLFIELIGAPPPPFDPNDPAAARNFTVSVRVKIADGFDVSGALQAAKLCRSILEHESIRHPLAGVERTVPYALITIFADAAVTDNSLPGLTAAQAKTAVSALFAGERMFAQFIT
jgi:hypothetical protein